MKLACNFVVQNSEFSVNQITLISRVEVCLIETWSEFVELISSYTKFFPLKEDELAIIGLFGVFKDFIYSTLLQSDFQLNEVATKRLLVNKHDYSAMHLNYLGYILHQVHVTRKIEVIFNDLATSSVLVEGRLFQIDLWNVMIPSLAVDKPFEKTPSTATSSTSESNDLDVDLLFQNKLVPLGIVLSKWSTELKNR